MILKKICMIAVFSLFTANPAFAADDLDQLLHEADRALGHKKDGPESQTQTNPAETIPDGKTSKKTLPKTNRRSETKSTRNVSTQDNSKAADTKASEPATLTPIDPARVSEILALDLQAQERERISRGHHVSGRIAIAQDRIPAVYRVEKDDDTFTVDSTTSLSGVAVEASRNVPIGETMGTGTIRGAMFFGVSAGAGALQGNVKIRRHGIEDDLKDYPYQIFPIDGGLSFGWMTDSQFSAWISGGYGADIVRQLGTGQTDTFSAIFSGETLGIGASWRSGAGYELFGHIKQRGVIGMNSKEPTPSHLAGRMILLGMGFPI